MSQHVFHMEKGFERLSDARGDDGKSTCCDPNHDTKTARCTEVWGCECVNDIGQLAGGSLNS